MNDLQLKIQESKTAIEVNTKSILEKVEELKLIKGDTVTATKIEKLCESLPQIEFVEGVTVVDGNREVIEEACKKIKIESTTDIKAIEDEITALKEDNKKQTANIKKLEKWETEYNEMMGILPEVKEVTEGV